MASSADTLTRENNIIIFHITSNRREKKKWFTRVVELTSPPVAYARRTEIGPRTRARLDRIDIQSVSFVNHTKQFEPYPTPAIEYCRAVLFLDVHVARQRIAVHIISINANSRTFRDRYNVVIMNEWTNPVSCLICGSTIVTILRPKTTRNKINFKRKQICKVLRTTFSEIVKHSPRSWKVMFVPTICRASVTIVVVR